MANIEIIDTEGMKMVKVTLNGESIRSESGALHYMQGDIAVSYTHLTLPTKRIV